MILIVDSGSSKTEFNLIDGESISHFKCIGLNPFIVSEFIIKKSLNQLDLPFEKVLKVYFYGAGCGTTEKSDLMKSILQKIFLKSEIMIFSDLLAAARSLFHKNSGVIGILGTGSNLAIYNGEVVKPFSTSLGYILGDEGSGNALGKRFIKAILSDKFDEDFEIKIGVDKSNILHDLYSHSYPNQYLASFAKLIHKHKTNFQMAKLINETFDEWIQSCLLPNNIKKISLSGSIAFYFKYEIKKICELHNIYIDSIIEKPIAGLTLFHKTYVL